MPFQCFQYDESRFLNVHNDSSVIICWITVVLTPFSAEWHEKSMHVLHNTYFPSQRWYYWMIRNWAEVIAVLRTTSRRSLQFLNFNYSGTVLYELRACYCLLKWFCVLHAITVSVAVYAFRLICWTCVRPTSISHCFCVQLGSKPALCIIQ